MSSRSFWEVGMIWLKIYFFLLFFSVVCSFSIFFFIFISTQRLIVHQRIQSIILFKKKSEVSFHIDLFVEWWFFLYNFGVSTVPGKKMQNKIKIISDYDF